jgi:high frequency lysogenization protein
MNHTTEFVLAFLQVYNLHLWRQLGGSSWSMIFSKRKLLQDIQALARLQYQVV